MIGKILLSAAVHLPRVFYLAFAVTLSLLCFVAGAQSQQPVNFGPSPYSSNFFYPEFITPPGALGGLFALARPDGIFYDPGRLARYGGIPSAFFRFVRAHEFGHIHRQHYGGSPGQYFHNELEADCMAARLLGWNSSAVQAAVGAYMNELPPGNMPGMPGSTARIENLKSCGR
jgi:hypothetical protein